MSRKQYSKELKLELVKKHLEDGISYWKLGKEYGIEASIIAGGVINTKHDFKRRVLNYVANKL